MTEKNILAYFHSPEQAEGAAKKLEALRVEDLAINRFSRYAGVGPSGASYKPGVSGSYSSWVPDTLNSHASSGIMAAADTAASGMSDGGQGGPTGRDILLTVVVDESVHHRAMSIIEQAGGMI
ncbi:hypothetical protein KQI74_17925 [Paenibacillus barcinonensis]|jgi:hypothetical protein|uniref:hypothetical protein n=1 Tax=Paenibacillus TaxID=44249 RepID=UPI001C10220D|nr:MULTISPECIES: hypothetical protein [Paenibacillus]MBU5354171.1 hypothetical protein [Paenibacillus barcinonensis]MDM5276431.1 hypothetical protein [Paenibacillus silvae]